MVPTIRKFDSGAEKRKKKKRLKEQTQSQRGAIDRFIIRESHTSQNQTTSVDDIVHVNADDSYASEDLNINAKA